MIHEILLIHISHYQNFSYRVRSRSRHGDKNIYTCEMAEINLKTNIHFGELSGNLIRSGKTPGAALPPSYPRSRVSANRASEAQGVKWDHTFPGT